MTKRFFVAWAAPTYLIYFVVQPIPAGLVTKQIVFDALAIALLGPLVARLHGRPSPAWTHGAGRAPRFHRDRRGEGDRPSLSPTFARGTPGVE